MFTAEKHDQNRAPHTAMAVAATEFDVEAAGPPPSALSVGCCVREHPADRWCPCCTPGDVPRGEGVRVCRFYIPMCYFYQGFVGSLVLGFMIFVMAKMFGG